MAITNDQVVSIMESRNLSPIRRPEGWIVFRNDDKIRVRVPPQPTLSLAIELADIELTRLEDIQQERRARRIILEQQKAVFFHTARRITSTVEGQQVIETVFDIRKSSDNSLTPIVGRASVAEAWGDVIKAQV